MAAVKVKGFLSEIETLCECSICYHTYDDKCHVPRVLPCQHTFCTECLSKHCRRRKLKCPLCNQEHNVKNENVDKLPKDFTTCNLRDLLETFSKSLCKECQNQNQVKFICKTCNVQMCKSCWDNKKQSSCNLHAIEIINDLSTTPAENSTFSYNNNICQTSGHENNELKYFCCEKTCSLPVCANCIVECHQYHATKPVKDEYETRQKLMQNQCQAVKNKIEGANSVLESLLKNISLMNESHTKGQNNLKEQAMRGITYINEFEINSKKSAEEKFLQCMMLLEKKKEQAISFIENATECCSISEEALTGRSIVTFLSVEKTLRDKLAFFEQSDIIKPMITMPDTADFELQAETLELKEKIDRMTNTNNGIINKSTLVKEMVKKISFMELIISIWLTLILLVTLLLWINPIPYSHVFAVDGEYRLNIL